jgi:polyisoprenyl-phosphate glycosyltransferase
MPKVSVIIPVYYNQESLPLLFVELSKIEQVLQKDGFELELIFVDDGSGDNSFGELLKIKQQRPETRLVKLTRNFGAIRACKIGAQFVTGDSFVFLAADLQDPPELIFDMVKNWQEGAKYVICVRNGRDDPITTKLFSAIYYSLLRLYVIPNFPPQGYDLALHDKALLPYLLQQSGRTIYLQVFLYWLGYKPTVIYYNRQKRQYGHSRWNFAKRFAASLDVLLGFSVIPIRAISLIGLLVSLVSFSYGIIVVVSAFFGKSVVPGFATLAALLTFLLGLVIIMLGVIGEYIWRIFDEVNQRPEAVIEAIY